MRPWSWLARVVVRVSCVMSDAMRYDIINYCSSRSTRVMEMHVPSFGTRCTVVVRRMPQDDWRPLQGTPHSRPQTNAGAAGTINGSTTVTNLPTLHCRVCHLLLRATVPFRTVCLPSPPLPLVVVHSLCTPSHLPPTALRSSPRSVATETELQPSIRSLTHTATLPPSHQAP